MATTTCPADACFRRGRGGYRRKFCGVKVRSLHRLKESAFDRFVLQKISGANHVFVRTYWCGISDTRSVLSVSSLVIMTMI